VAAIALKEEDPKKAAKAIVDLAYKKMSLDNLSCIVIDLREKNFEYL
jgi:serine/threonine protein phosphatase PrpC